MNKTLPLPLVTATIPCHNKAATIKRAIDSVKQQTLNNLECYVLNDASTDESEQIILEAIKDDARFRYEKVNYRNVARVRNHGASKAQGLFLCFLDGDDWIDARFLEVCIKPLLQDRSLGISYSGLRWHKPDGTTEISVWPGQFDYDKQLRKQNQCPTCSIIRRECWERLGGQNPKYSILGAGAEDGEFYLRAGAYGWGAIKATDEALFNYSLGSGIVSGNPSYIEPDWTELHPWAGTDGGNGSHPFASMATPKQLSHPVSQYDEPDISVIIPVGPGHEEKVRNALDSLESQTYRKWEAIVVWDNPNTPIPDSSVIAYPYVKWMHNAKERGPGGARNNGVLHARAPFLVFLDADDWLYPTALQEMLDAWLDNHAIIYTDFVGKAIIDDPSQLDASLRNNVLWRNDRTNETILSYRNRQDADFDCERAQRQPENPPYVWCNVTSLIPKVWHDEIGGFDESLESWEDVDYHWRMAKAGKCYYRIEKELMVYQFHTGQRREFGRQEHKNLLQYLLDKHKEIDIMACSGCGGKGRTRQVPQATGPFSASSQQQVARLNDNDWAEVLYNHPNKGRHQVTGGFVFDRRLDGVPMINRGGDRWSINYGQRGGGERFLVHLADVQVQSHVFVPVQSSVKETAPEPKKEPLPEPQRIESQEIIDNLEAVREISERDEPVVAWLPSDSDNEPERTFNLQMLPGVGAALARQLEADGVTTEDAFVALGVEGLMKYKGIGENKAKLILRAIEGMKQER